MNEEKLINLVRHYVFLYDTSHPKYMDSSKKDAAWNEISQLLNQPASACKHKWQGLRDAYRRALNKRKQRISEQPSAKIKKWKYEDEISYLNKYLSEKKKVVQNDDDGDQNDENVSNPDIEGSSKCYKSIRDEIEQVENIEQYIVAMDPANFAHSQSDTTVNITKNSQKWANTQPSSSPYATTNYPDDVIKEFKESEIAHDQMDLFFLSLSNTVKSFSPYLQAIAKNKIFNLVSELEIQQLAPAKSNTVTQPSTRLQSANCSTHEQNTSAVCVKIEHSHVD